MISEDDLVALHDQCVSVHGTAQQVLDWFSAQGVDPDGIMSFGKMIGRVGENVVANGELPAGDAIGAAAMAGLELGIRVERLRRERV